MANIRANVIFSIDITLPIPVLSVARHVPIELRQTAMFTLEMTYRRWLQPTHRSRGANERVRRRSNCASNTTLYVRDKAGNRLQEGNPNRHNSVQSIVDRTIGLY